MSELPLPIELLPHRPPFLYLDRCLECSENFVRATRCFSASEPFFEGHFPGAPMVPGVILVEGMAQTLAYLAALHFPSVRLLLTGIDRCRIRRTVRPGETVIFSVRVEKIAFHKAIVGQGEAYVASEKAAEARITGFAEPAPA